MIWAWSGGYSEGSNRGRYNMPRDETNAKSFNSTQIQLFLSDEDNNKSGPTTSNTLPPRVRVLESHSPTPIFTTSFPEYIRWTKRGGRWMGQQVYSRTTTSVLLFAVCIFVGDNEESEDEGGSGRFWRWWMVLGVVLGALPTNKTRSLLKYILGNLHNNYLGLFRGEKTK